MITTSRHAVNAALGALEFANGFRGKDTVEKSPLPAPRRSVSHRQPKTPLSAARKGCRSYRPKNETLIIFEMLLDSKPVFLTPNTETFQHDRFDRSSSDSQNRSGTAFCHESVTKFWSCLLFNGKKVVEPTGFEPVTSSMPLRRSTN
jgi:hypothetical protein